MAEMTKQDLDNYISREVIRLASEQSAIDERLNVVIPDEMKGLDHEGNLDSEVEMEFEREIELLQSRRQEVVRDIDCLHGLRQLLTHTSDSTAESSG